MLKGVNVYKNWNNYNKYTILNIKLVKTKMDLIFNPPHNPRYIVHQIRDIDDELLFFLITVFFIKWLIKFKFCI